MPALAVVRLGMRRHLGILLCSSVAATCLGTTRRIEFLSKFSPVPSPNVPSYTAALVERLARRVLAFFVRHAALLRPLSQAGKLQLAKVPFWPVLLLELVADHEGKKTSTVPDLARRSCLCVETKCLDCVRMFVHCRIAMTSCEIHMSSMSRGIARL